MILRWFSSGTVRQATDLCHRVKKILRAQWDLLAPAAREAVEQAMHDVRTTIKSGGDKKAILQRAEALETAANKWLKPYPNASVRENVDVVLVALVVAMGVRTFFLQPMAIPTGSMQPTLFGIMPNRATYEPALEIPSLPVRVFDSLVRGINYYHVVARNDGEIRLLDQEPRMVFPFVKRQRFSIGSHSYSVWFPPEGLFTGPNPRVTLRRQYRSGEDVLKLKVTTGDRLFVDRVTYNFRRPQRGEIIIFETNGIEGLEPGTHYIKRLVGLGGEKMRLGNDRHLVVNGERLDASTSHFENVYSFDPKTPPRENQHSGHVNGSNGRGYLAEKFPDEKTEFEIKPKHYLVFGDNTLNSKDSRSWGDFPQEKVIGKCFFVFWPITSRFGWGVR